VAVVRGLSVQVVCAAAGDIVVGERSEYAHVLSAGKALLLLAVHPTISRHVTSLGRYQRFSERGARS
jgi:hypothetical protein